MTDRVLRPRTLKQDYSLPTNITKIRVWNLISFEKKIQIGFDSKTANLSLWVEEKLSLK